MATIKYNVDRTVTFEIAIDEPGAPAIVNIIKRSTLNWSVSGNNFKVYFSPFCRDFIISTLMKYNGANMKTWENILNHVMSPCTMNRVTISSINNQL